MIGRKKNQYNNFKDKMLTKLDSVTVDRNPSSDNDLANKKFFDESLGGDNILRLNQTLENSLKVSVGENVYNPTKYDRIQITDTTIIIHPNNGGHLPQQWNIKCLDRNGAGGIRNFINLTKTKVPTSSSGAKPLSSVGDSFMYIETSSS